jgi:hypothetical protein
MKTTNYASENKMTTISLMVNLSYGFDTQKIKINMLKNCGRQLIKGITYNLNNLNLNTKKTNLSILCIKTHKK